MKPLSIHSAINLLSGALLVSSGYAAELDVTRTTVLMASPGSSVLVDAVISNPTDHVVFLIGISSDVDVQFATDNLFDEFRAIAPDSLLPGETWEGPVVRLTIAPEAVVESAPPVSVFFTGGDHSFDAQDLAIFTFGLIDSVGSWMFRIPRIRSPSAPCECGRIPYANRPRSPSSSHCLAKWTSGSTTFGAGRSARSSMASRAPGVSRRLGRP